MEDRATIVRNHILDRIESGELKKGDKLPGAREIASELNFSLITVQNAIDELVKEGVLLTIARRGTFVHELWDSRVLQRNITIFFSDLPWVDYFRDIVREKLPQCRVCSRFISSVYEIRTTHYVQAHQSEYLDMSRIFNECAEDKSDIIMTPFNSFYIDDKLIGIPIGYSPRVLFYNSDILAEAGCDEPYTGWSWDEFIKCILQLKKHIPAEDIINWHVEPFLWLNFVVRSGGSLIDFNQDDPVRIDSCETRKGLKLFRKLRDILGITPPPATSLFLKKFLAGKAAMNIDAREFLAKMRKSGLKNWKAVALPRIPGGKDLNVQATDLFCVKKSCVDMENAKALVKILLSRDFQDHLAALGYGIPIRKSSSAKAMDYSNPADMLFLAESAKMFSSYNLDSVELYNLVYDSVQMLLSGNEDIDTATGELATMVRTYIKLKTQIRMTA